MAAPRDEALRLDLPPTVKGSYRALQEQLTDTHSSKDFLDSFHSLSEMTVCLFAVTALALFNTTTPKEELDDFLRLISSTLRLTKKHSEKFRSTDEEKQKRVTSDVAEIDLLPCFIFNGEIQRKYYHHATPKPEASTLTKALCQLDSRFPAPTRNCDWKENTKAFLETIETMPDHLKYFFHGLYQHSRFQKTVGKEGSLLIAAENFYRVVDERTKKFTYEDAAEICLIHLALFELEQLCALENVSHRRPNPLVHYHCAKAFELTAKIIPNRHFLETALSYYAEALEHGVQIELQTELHQKIETLTQALIAKFCIMHHVSNNLFLFNTLLRLRVPNILFPIGMITSKKNNIDNVCKQVRIAFEAAYSPSTGTILAAQKILTEAKNILTEIKETHDTHIRLAFLIRELETRLHHLVSKNPKDQLDLAMSKLVNPNTVTDEQYQESLDTLFNLCGNFKNPPADPIAHDARERFATFVCMHPAFQHSALQHFAGLAIGLSAKEKAISKKCIEFGLPSVSLAKLSFQIKKDLAAPIPSPPSVAAVTAEEPQVAAGAEATPADVSPPVPLPTEGSAEATPADAPLPASLSDGSTASTLALSLPLLPAAGVVVMPPCTLLPIVNNPGILSAVSIFKDQFGTVVVDAVWDLLRKTVVNSSDPSAALELLMSHLDRIAGGESLDVVPSSRLGARR